MEMNECRLLTCLFLLLLTTSAQSALQSNQHQNINYLREKILPRIPKSSIVYNWTRDDLYLQKWLKASSYDVSKAVDKILRHLEWRKKEGVDQAHFESPEWSFIKSEYVIVTGHKSRKGQPVAEFWLSEWNVRRAILAGLKHKLEKWIILMVDTQQRELYEARAKGVNVTKAILLMDLEGFNFFNHGCSQCLQMYSYWALDWEANYPDLYESVMMVNTNPAFRILITTMKSVLRQETMKSLEPYPLKRFWAPVLDKLIDPNERSVRFGGNLKLGV